jgi:hypothetical protein
MRLFLNNFWEFLNLKMSFSHIQKIKVDLYLKDLQFKSTAKIQELWDLQEQENQQFFN